MKEVEVYNYTQLTFISDDTNTTSTSFFNMPSITEGILNNVTSINTIINTAIINF